MTVEQIKTGRRDRRLPEGWEWQHWPDQSGSLRAPDGKNYFNYDLNTREFRLTIMHPVWEYHPDLSLDEFIAYAEGEVLEYLKEQRKKKPGNSRMEGKEGKRKIRNGRFLS